jgi:rhodanese-related sulfurtransferase
MPSSVKDMLAAANASVPRITPAEAADLMERGEALVVDVRDTPATTRTTAKAASSPPGSVF